MVHLNGIYNANGCFCPVKPPTAEDLDKITHTVAKRVSRYLERSGYLYRDAESEYLDLSFRYLSVSLWGEWRKEGLDAAGRSTATIG
jgi:hypothetical protein